MVNGQVRRITWRTADVARVFSLAILFLFLWKFFWMVYSAFFLGLLAVLLAIVIHTPARFLSRWMPFRVGLVLSVVVFLGAVGLLLISVVPQVIEQVTQLAIQLPSAVDSAGAWFEQKVGGRSSDQLSERVSQQVGEFIGRFVPLAFNAITAVLGGFALVVLAIFLAAQPETYRALVLGLVSPDQRERWERVYDIAGHHLKLWVMGKAFTMVLIGLAVYIGLVLFKIPGALALASLAAIMEFVPNFGPTIAAAPAIAAAFMISPATALWVAVFYFLVQQVQNAITVPLVEQRAVNIPPAALMLWQLMLAVGFGLMALFVATPLLAVIVVAFRIVYYEPALERAEWNRRDGGPATDALDETEPAATPTLDITPGS